MRQILRLLKKYSSAFPLWETRNEGLVLRGMCSLWMEEWLQHLSDKAHPNPPERLRHSFSVGAREGLAKHSPCFSKTLIIFSFFENAELRDKDHASDIKIIKEVQFRLLSLGGKERRPGSTENVLIVDGGLAAAFVK